MEFWEYFKPVPVIHSLTSDAWGASNVLPRDVENGMEDLTGQWVYWDGRILKAPDGKFHLYGSRWAEADGH